MAQDFLSVEDLSDDDINAILGLGTSDERAAALEKQLAMAQGLREAPGPEGRGYGGVYTAASPLEHAAHAWKGIKAGKDAEKISAEQMALMQEQNEARKRFFEAMMMQKNQQGGQQYSDEYGPQPFDPSQVY